MKFSKEKSIFKNMIKARFYSDKIKHKKPLGPQGGKTMSDESVFTGQNRLWSLRPHEKSPLVEGYYPNGFKINGMDIYGSVILFPRGYFLWDMIDYQSLTFDSLKFFEIIVPKVDILLIGTGKNLEYDSKNDEISKKFKINGITTEFMSTPNAIATFNILMEEERKVGSAIITVEESEWLK
eukprot:TRINITY_DN4901_c0_g2_i1.p2 TRINITY_DN4901_c0_g2~~TRINITY_DN4901_c0_g2_i1.p2  ORF type:complete len:181 (-),score=47.08 TRINITY_DN4901_c0_g2_i1:65-607(-)